MREGGISDCEERTFCSMEHSDFDAKTVLKRILRKYPGFTALVTGSDLDLLRMVRAMGAINLPWAGKIALTGFGNVAGISNVLPMATIDQHPYRLGRRAAECLIDMIEHGQPPEPVHDILDVEILNAHHIPILNRNFH